MAKNIKERLDKLKEKMQTEDFLHGRGLSNEAVSYTHLTLPTIA